MCWLENNYTHKMLYVIDFGRAKLFRENQQHMPYIENQSLTQRPSYSSINAQIGIAQGRRDDLQSHGYMLVYFLKGSWDGISEYTRKRTAKRVSDCKLARSVADLCVDCPQEFATFSEYCRSLAFSEDPNYSYLKRVSSVMSLSAKALGTTKSLTGVISRVLWNQNRRPTINPVQTQAQRKVHKKKKKNTKQRK